LLNLNDLLEAVSGDEFDERPVPIEVFVESEDYLNLPDQPLSEEQLEMVRASTQIFKLHTLIMLHGEAEGKRIHDATVNEVIAQIGKGGGKDHTSAIACAYIVYLLLCLKSPSEYYDSPATEAIDIINIAINADQARQVFFKKFKDRIENCRWFDGKYELQGNNAIIFDKNIRVFSGHSQRESWEGYNTFYVVLDEISGFALDIKTGNEQSATAQAVYDMYSASVTSRFADYGKLVLLSFPRFIDDFIQQRYKKVVGEKEVVMMSHTFKINPELPEGTEGNEFTIEWEQDHIVSYTIPRTWARKRTSWEFNPTKSPQDYIRAFMDNPAEALGKYCCMPPYALDAFFKDREKIENAFRASNGVGPDGRFYEDFKPKEGVRYFVHVDLAKVQDKCAVAVAHVEKWQRRQIGAVLTEPAPVVVVDALRWWKPTKEKMVDFTEVREFILDIQRRGFELGLVTFDRWNSADIIKELREYGLKAELLSVAKQHYTDMAMVVHEERLAGPSSDELVEELLALKITKQDKVDHTSKSSKDLSDAVCGAIYNAIKHTPRDGNAEITVFTVESFRHSQIENQHVNDPNVTVGAIKAPSSSQMPMELSDFIANLRIIGD
jgi:hypothetical protein